MAIKAETALYLHDEATYKKALRNHDKSMVARQSIRYFRVASEKGMHQAYHVWFQDKRDIQSGLVPDTLHVIGNFRDDGELMIAIQELKLYMGKGHD